MKNKDINTNNSLEELVDKLKNKDKYYARLSKGLQIVYFILLPIYLLLLIAYIIEGSTWNDIVGMVCFAVSMLIFALFFRMYYEEYNNVDYAKPTLIMLKEAAYRYQPFQLRALWILLALLLMDAGLSLSTFDLEYFGYVQILFLGNLVLAGSIGYIVWWFRYRPLRMDTLRLIKEIEEEK